MRRRFAPGVVLAAFAAVAACSSEPPPRDAFDVPVLRTVEDASGVRIEVLREGEGRAAAHGDRVELHYRLELENGAEVDVSRRNKPLSFLVGRGQVIDGMHPAVTGMRAGELRRAIIPPKQGYGPRSMGKIPPGSTLVFHLEMVAVHAGSSSVTR